MPTFYTTSVSAPFTCNICQETKTNKAKLKCSSCHGARPICGSCARSWVSGKTNPTCPWDRTRLGSSTSTTPRTSTSQPRTSQPRTSGHHGAGSSRRHGLDGRSGSSSSSRRHGLDGRPSSSSRRYGLDGR